MKPSEGSKVIIEEFEGIIQSFDDVITSPGAVRHCFGVTNTVEKKLVKLGGCLMLSSSCSSMGAVISISQLEYEDEEKLVLLSGSQRQLMPCSDIYPHADSVSGTEEFGMGL